MSCPSLNVESLQKTMNVSIDAYFTTKYFYGKGGIFAIIMVELVFLFPELLLRLSGIGLSAFCLYPLHPLSESLTSSRL